MNPPRIGNSGQQQQQQEESSSNSNNNSSMLLHQDMAKLSLDQATWVRSPPAPYILVNPLAPLPPHYVPYIYPGYQVQVRSLTSCLGSFNVMFAIISFLSGFFLFPAVIFRNTGTQIREFSQHIELDSLCFLLLYAVG
jgi:hypothetical protein